MGYADVHFAVKETSDAIEAFVLLMLYLLAATVFVLIAVAWGTWHAGSWAWRTVRAHRDSPEVLP